MAYSIAFSQATEIMIYVGIKAEEEEGYKYLTLQTISEKLNIPVPSVKRIVGLLKNDGLLISKTGISGGIMLAKPLERITLLDIFRAIEGNKSMFKIHLDFDTSKMKHTKLAENVISRMEESTDNAEQAMLKTLKKQTLSDLIR